MIVSSTVSSFLAAALWTAAPSVQVEVRAAELDPETGPHIERKIRDDLEAALVAAEVPIANDASRSLSVRLSWIDRERFDYGIDVELRQDVQAEANPTRFECRLCTLTELTERVAAELRPFVQQLAHDDTPLGIADSPLPSPMPLAASRHTTEPIPQERVDTDAFPQPARSQTRDLKIAGITLATVGGVAVLTGVGLLIADGRVDRPQSEGFNGDTQQLETTVGGAVAIVFGGLAVAGGATLLVKTRERPKSISFIPRASRTSVHLAFHARF